jgi:ADP-ribose pyrophosphatase YjhB (NUDIX family)
MKRVPFVSIVLENAGGEVLLLLRENRSTMTCPNHWTLLGGKVRKGNTWDGGSPQLKAETGFENQIIVLEALRKNIRSSLSTSMFMCGKSGASLKLLLFCGPGYSVFQPGEISIWTSAMDSTLLDEYFLVHER